MARPILVANWKNYPKSLFEARKLIKGLSRNTRPYKQLNFSIAPPFTYFELVSSRTRHFAKLVSQDITSLAKGTATGTVTPDILQSFGVRMSIIGHSEMRKLGETSEMVSRKAKTALATGIIPLVCVGELSRDQDGEHFEFLRNQIKASLSGIRQQKDVAKMIIAYEPVWAIGKTAKDAMKPSDLSQSVIFIRKILADLFGRTLAEKIPILYGGSVEPSVASELYNKTGIRGFLVGHASLDPKNLKIIAESLL